MDTKRCCRKSIGPVSRRRNHDHDPEQRFADSNGADQALRSRGLASRGRWPDGHVEDIAGFKSELEANDWIADHFQEWLEMRKNGTQHSARQPGGC